MEDLYKYENELRQQGIKYIGGVDEVGRGPLIGSVVTACVVLPEDFILEGLTDSKKLSEKKRECFYKIIMDKALAVGIGEVSEKIIDEVNIYEATKIAMKEAIDKVREQLNLEHVLIDAMPLNLDIPTTSIIKGDAKSISIAAASVVAKVTRDRMMYELDKVYPMYDLAHNKGYGTKKHLQAIEEYGITKYHRLSYAPVVKYKDKRID
jgi:ribonuclease HII